MKRDKYNLGYADFLLGSEDDHTLFGRSSSSIVAFDTALDDWMLEPHDAQLEQRAEAAGRILSCRDRNLPRLDLSRLGLSSVPPVIGELHHLEWLLLVSNRLTHLPVEITRLQGLIGLYVSYNRLRELPAELGKLSALEHLRADHNELESLPDSLVQINALKHLSFSENRVEHVPEGIWVLPQIDAETQATLRCMAQENRIAFLARQSRSVDALLDRAPASADPSTAAAPAQSEPQKFTPPPSGVFGLLAMQRASLGAEESVLRGELETLREDLPSQYAHYPQYAHSR